MPAFVIGEPLKCLHIVLNIAINFDKSVIKAGNFKSSENIQKKEGGSDRSVQIIDFHQLTIKARESLHVP